MPVVLSSTRSIWRAGRTEDPLGARSVMRVGKRERTLRASLTLPRPCAAATGAAERSLKSEDGHETWGGEGLSMKDPRSPGPGAPRAEAAGVSIVEALQENHEQGIRPPAFGRVGRPSWNLS